jgi:hypothetical protein
MKLFNKAILIPKWQLKERKEINHAHHTNRHE